MDEILACLTMNVLMKMSANFPELVFKYFNLFYNDGLKNFVRSHDKIMHKNEGGFSSHLIFEEDVGHIFLSYQDIDLTVRQRCYQMF